MDIPSGVLPEQLDTEQLKLIERDIELAFQSINGREERILQTLSIGAGFAGATAIIVSTPQISVSVEIAWMIPLVFLLFYGSAVFLLYHVVQDYWILRFQYMRINEMYIGKGDMPILKYERRTVFGEFLSTSRGNPKFRITFSILVVTNVVILVAVILTTWKIIYTDNHLAGTLFLCSYSIIALLFAFSISGVYVDFPKVVQTFLKQWQKDGKVVPKSLDFRQLSTKSLLLTILPRPFDIVTKGPIFIYGVIAALAIAGLQSTQLPIINLLFSTGSEWVTASQVPTWSILMLALAYFLVAEVFLQQAKCLWDDLRDVERDKMLPWNQNRAYVSGAMSREDALLQISLRWPLALALSFFLGSWSLLVAFLLISLHQAVYVLWGKTKAKTHPFLLLWIISFNSPLRVLVGILVIGQFPWQHPPLLFILAIFYFQSFGFMSGFYSGPRNLDTQSG